MMYGWLTDWITDPTVNDCPTDWMTYDWLIVYLPDWLIKGLLGIAFTY